MLGKPHSTSIYTPNGLVSADFDDDCDEDGIGIDDISIGRGIVTDVNTDVADRKTEDRGTRHPVSTQVISGAGELGGPAWASHEIDELGGPSRASHEIGGPAWASRETGGPTWASREISSVAAGPCNEPINSFFPSKLQEGLIELGRRDVGFFGSQKEGHTLTHDLCMDPSQTSIEVDRHLGVTGLDTTFPSKPGSNSVSLSEIWHIGINDVRSKVDNSSGEVLRDTAGGPSDSSCNLSGHRDTIAEGTGPYTCEYVWMEEMTFDAPLGAISAPAGIDELGMTEGGGHCVDDCKPFGACVSSDTGCTNIDSLLLTSDRQTSTQEAGDTNTSSRIPPRACTHS